MAVNALCVMDLGCAAYTAGALALLPPGGCAGRRRGGRRAHRHAPRGLHEVVNVLSALFNAAGARTPSCTSSTPRARTLPGDIAGMLAGFNRIDLAIEVAGYGKGDLSLVLAH